MSASAKAEFKRMHPHGMTLPCHKLLDMTLSALPHMPYGSADKWQLYHEGKDSVADMCTHSDFETTVKMCAHVVSARRLVIEFGDRSCVRDDGDEYVAVLLSRYQPRGGGRSPLDGLFNSATLASPSGYE